MVLPKMSTYSFSFDIRPEAKIFLAFGLLLWPNVKMNLRSFTVRIEFFVAEIFQNQFPHPQKFRRTLLKIEIFQQRSKTNRTHDLDVYLNIRIVKEIQSIFFLSVQNKAENTKSLENTCAANARTTTFVIFGCKIKVTKCLRVVGTHSNTRTVRLMIQIIFILL